jgi:tRNA G18 (ribose-2'-O)-methylase SpoU
MAESEKVIRRAMAAGHRPRSLLLSRRWLEPMADLVRQVRAAGAPVLVGEADTLQAVTGFNVHRGAIAAMHRPPLAAAATLVRSARRVVILEDVVDHTNVGAVFRSVAGIGADAVLVTPRCADPLYRRAVRVSMGTVFQVPWTRLAPWPQGLDLLREHGLTVAALALTDGAVDLDILAADPPERLALVLGTEGDGLSGAVVQGADIVVRIPMAGGVDSLNVAAATAVALWALRPASGRQGQTGHDLGGGEGAQVRAREHELAVPHTAADHDEVALGDP